MEVEERVKKKKKQERERERDGDNKKGQNFSPPFFKGHMSCWVNSGLTELTQLTHHNKIK